MAKSQPAIAIAPVRFPSYATRLVDSVSASEMSSEESAIGVKVDTLASRIAGALEERSYSIYKFKCCFIFVFRKFLNLTRQDETFYAKEPKTEYIFTDKNADLCR